ncbi:MAG: FliH/SctL family protein [Terriglobales bacterium]
MLSDVPKPQVPESAPFAYDDAGGPGGAPGVSNSGPVAEERIRRQQAEWFEQGRQSGQREVRSECDAALIKHRDQIGRAFQEFARERQDYYRRVEGEVVDLALAVARKILHREVQIDPEALTGIVRITLEKLDTGTKVSLRVYPQEAAEWRHYFACRVGDVPAPEVHEDPGIAPGECRIETLLGSTEIGLESQLKEIETGLLDLLAERPGAIASGASAARANPSVPGRTTETR